MNPLLLLAGNVLPGILDLLVGKRAEAVAKAVIGVIAKTTGSEDPAVVRREIEQNPDLAEKVRVELARIILEEKRLTLEAEGQQRRDAADAEAKARRDALDRDVARQKAQLDEIAAAQKAALDEREQALRNTEGARRLQNDIIEKDRLIARTPMVLSYIVTAGFFIVIGLFVFLKGRLETPVPAQFPPEVIDILGTLRPDQIAALVQPRSDFVIQIINIGIGALSAAFATVMSFWLGSSQSSRNKDVLVSNLQERAADSQERQARSNIEIAETVARSTAQTMPAAPLSDGTDTPAGPAADADAPPPEPGTDDPPPRPGKPAPAGLLGEIVPQLVRPHRHFPDSVSWTLTAAGVAIDGARAERTAGEPKTVERIWSQFGPFCAASARKHGVPVELIVATIATESGGDPAARRAEPAINDQSVGLMQTLVGTARMATGRQSLSADDLLDPAVSIDAGTAYIAQQRGSTHFDPPRVAAAYNAGSLRRDEADANRWRLRCFPRGTGRHIDNFVPWFNDAMQVSDDQDWGRANDCPSFVEALGGVAPLLIAATDITSPDFPPRPAFRAIRSTEERGRLFGAFQFTHEPLPDNRENIRILGDWEEKNIVPVTIPLQGLAGKPGPLTIRFHRNAAAQLIACWMEWEKANLLDRILTYDGAFVPRFQRRSTSKLSNHAFGSAFDVNAAWNPLGVDPAALGAKGCVRELVPIANAHGFYWGGHFNTRPDGMHFEIAQLL